MTSRLLALALLTISGCTVPTAGGDPEYVLSEGVIDGPSTLATSGDTTIHAVNVGEYSHTLVVTDDHGEVLAATGLVLSGTDATLEVDLAPGTYVFSCRIVAEDGDGNLVDHYEQGMHRTVTVSR